MNIKIQTILPVFCMAFIFAGCSDSKKISSNNQENPTLTVLLDKALEDMDIAEKRNRYSSNRIADMLVSDQYWYKKYPSNYAFEKIIINSKEYKNGVLDIIVDSKKSKYRYVAMTILAELNDPENLNIIWNEYNKKEISEDFRDWYIATFLPTPSAVLSLNMNSISNKIRSLKKSDTNSEIISQFLKETILKIYGYRDDNNDWNYNILRWSDMIYDINLTDYLKKNVPDVYAFRQLQLAKGYDPVVFVDLLRAEISNGYFPKALEKIYGNDKDAKACKKLIRLLTNEENKLHPKPKKGWKKRLVNMAKNNQIKLFTVK